MGMLGCKGNIVYERNVSFPKQQWTYDTIPSFSFRIDDTSKTYGVVLNFRHNKDYKYSNVFVLLHEKGPGLKDTAYRHEIHLAEPDGRWRGSASAGLYHNEYWIKENFRFPDTGQYTFSVEQNMRANPLVGVSNIGIRVFEAK